MIRHLCMCMCVFTEQAAGGSGQPTADPLSGLYEPKPSPDELALGEIESAALLLWKTPSLHLSTMLKRLMHTALFFSSCCFYYALE